MKKNQLKLGCVITYMQMAIGIAIGLLYTPVMTHLLGQSEYGLYNTVVSTISMLSILNMGFNSSYIRYYSKYRKQNDNKSIYKLNGMFLLIFIVIGCIALVCGMFLSFHLNIVFKNGLTYDEYKIAQILMILLTINLSISFPMSIFSNIISAHERFIILKLIGMLKTVISPLITLPLLLMGYRSIAMVLVTVIVTLITDIVYLIYVIKILKQKFEFKDFEKELFKSLFVYTSFIALNLIVDQINWNIDKILLGRFQGTAAVAIYAIGFSLYQYYQMFSTSISSVFTPYIHEIINNTLDNKKKQRKLLTELFVRVGRIQFLVLGLVASGLIIFGQQFIVNYWVGLSYKDSYYVMILLVIPSSIPLIQNLGIEIQRAQNKHKFRSIAYFFMSIINLLISIVLCQVYGAIGSALGTAISLIIANGIIMNIYYHNNCNIDILLFWKNVIYLLRGMIFPFIFGELVNIVFINNNIIIFIMKIVLYTGVYCLSMWFFAMNKYEKKLIYELINKILLNKSLNQ